jgi:prevent-host-death family protein
MAKTAAVKNAKGKDKLSRLLGRAERGERVVLRRGRKPVAAVVPIQDLDFLEKLEDRIDVEEARRRLNEPTIPWEQVKRELGL